MGIWQSKPQPQKKVEDHIPLRDDLKKSMRSHRCPICKTIFEEKSIKEFQKHLGRCQIIKKNTQTISIIYTNIQEKEDPLEDLGTIHRLETEINELEQTNKKEFNQHVLFNNFNDRIDSFQSQLKTLKRNWEEGAETIEIERDHILNESYERFKKIDPLKELKIAFKGEVNNDSGGLIREWLTVLFKEILDPKTSLFERADTKELSYIIKKNLQQNDTNKKMFFFIGQLFAKALLENLTINCCLNLVIYLILFDKEITGKDLPFIDQEMNNAFNNLKKEERIENFQLDYTIDIETETGEIKNVELIENGSERLVTNENLDNYIDVRVNHFADTQKPFVDQIKKGFESLIPWYYLNNLTHEDFEVILNGRDYIDIEDWQDNTNYINYVKTDKIVVWFWEILKTLNEDQLRHILQYCTGTNRVPIGGFIALESNRGQNAPFSIQKACYNEHGNIYIRAHTCFNRIDIPEYPTKTELKQGIDYLLKNEALGFGIS